MHSLQCCTGVVKPALVLPWLEYSSRKDASLRKRIRKIPSFRGWSSVEKFAQLLAQGQPGPVQAALHRRDRKLQGVCDIVVGEPIHVLEQEDRAVVFRQLLDGLVDGAAELGAHHPLVRPLGPVAAAGGLEVTFGREAGTRELERLLAERIRRPALAAQAHERAVCRDAIEPAAELRLAAEERQLLVGV